MASFSEELKSQAQPIWERIFAHPFLQEIKNGTLPLEKFRYYLTQDYLYLEGFARTVAQALAKAPNSQKLEELSHRVLTPVERPLHHKLMPEIPAAVSEAAAFVSEIPAAVSEFPAFVSEIADAFSEPTAFVAETCAEDSSSPVWTRSAAV